jgi:hypothetical protein
MSFKKDSFDAIGPTAVAFETLGNIPNSAQTFGVSVTGSQCGVYGESSRKPIGTRPPSDIAPEGTGVAGRGDQQGVKGSGPRGVVGVGDDVGVFGDSEKGVGVHGRSVFSHGVTGESTSGRGGVFTSGDSAQVQLTPSGPRGVLSAPIPTTPLANPKGAGFALPKSGRGGDLMAVMDSQRQCTLWFCVRESGGTAATPAQWAQVLLGKSFVGEK